MNFPHACNFILKVKCGQSQTWRNQLDRPDLLFLDSFHVGDRWPNVTTTDSWSREFITESPAILFKRKDDATDLKHLSFNVLTAKSFTICGIDWNVEGNIAETENNERVADTIGHTIGGSPVNGADSVKPVSLLFKI